MTLPSPIVAFKLLRKAGISKRQEIQLVLTGMGFDQKDTIFSISKSSFILAFLMASLDNNSGMSELTTSVVTVIFYQQLLQECCMMPAILTFHLLQFSRSFILGK